MIHYQIVAYSASLAKSSSLGEKIFDNTLSKARLAFLWEDLFNLALNLFTASRVYHDKLLLQEHSKVAYFFFICCQQFYSMHRLQKRVLRYYAQAQAIEEVGIVGYSRYVGALSHLGQRD